MNLVENLYADILMIMEIMNIIIQELHLILNYKNITNFLNFQKKKPFSNEKSVLILVLIIKSIYFFKYTINLYLDT